MKVIEVIDFIEVSSARIIKVRCSDEKLWVIRCKKKNKNSRRLFSEYVGGLISRELGIYHPDVQIVDIPLKIIRQLNSIENLFDETCLKGVATLYIEDLKEIILIPKSLALYVNSNHIFGYIVFIFWIHLSDYHKQQNIQRTPDNELVFLDFDLAFSSNVEEWGSLPNYDDMKIAINQPEFLEPFTEKLEPYEEWFSNLLELSKSGITNKIGLLPDCWQIPNDYLKYCLDSLLDNRINFVQEFKNSINLKKTLKS